MRRSKKHHAWCLVVIGLVSFAVVSFTAGFAAGDGPVPNEEPMDVLILAPMGGIFHAGGAHDAPPLVRIGTVLVPETVVGAIDPTCASSTSPVQVLAWMHATVVEVLVEDGETVAFGQPLFKVRPPQSPVR